MPREAAVAEDRTVAPDDVAPAHNYVADFGHELRVILADVRENERPCGFQGRRLEKREVEVLSRNAIEGSMEAVNVVFGYGDDSVSHRRVLPRR